MTKSTRKKIYQGFLLALELSDHHFSLKLFRLIPIRRIPLADILLLRIASRDDYFGRGFLFRNRFWPVLGHSRRRPDFTVYLIKTRKRERIFVRLQPRMHYFLRGDIADHVHAFRRANTGAHKGLMYAKPE